MNSSVIAFLSPPTTTKSSIMKYSSVIYAVTAVIIALLAVGPPSTTGSLLPWWLPRSERPLSGRFPDPFRILEHTPFGFERDDAAVVSMARVDWRETPTSHEIVIDVPGMKKEELKIEMEENRILRVSGERKREEEKKGEHWHQVERSHGKFWRQFRLPDNADIDAVAAKLEDGVLTIKFAKLLPEQIKGPRVVSIAGGDGGVVEKLTAGEAKKIEL